MVFFIFVFQTTSSTLSIQILKAVQSILNYDNANYFLIEPIHPLAQFIQQMPYKDQKVKIGILKLVEFVAMQLQWVPSQELVAMTILFKGDRWVYAVKLKLDNL